MRREGNTSERCIYDFSYISASGSSDRKSFSNLSVFRGFYSIKGMKRGQQESNTEREMLGQSRSVNIEIDCRFDRAVEKTFLIAHA